MTADLNRAFADYAAALAEDPERALYDLQALFLDEATCLARVEFLRALGGKPVAGPLHFSPEWSAQTFSREVQLISQSGLFPAWRRGLLRPERLAALAGDPNALWQVHRAVADSSRTEPHSPHAAGGLPPKEAAHISQIETIWPVVMQAHGGTPDAVGATQVILSRYRPAVYRYLLACVGSADAADELCSEFSYRFVRGDFRNADPQKGRFRDLLKTALYHLIIDYHKRRQRGMQPLAADGRDVPDSVDSVCESDRQFLETWRADLLNKAWDALAEEERRGGQPTHTVLHFRAAHPELRSAQMAEQFSERLGKRVSADWVRQWLHKARERFADLLLQEVAASLREPTPDSVEEELIDLGLFEYCKTALLSWREREAGHSP
jgi:RNA polymerase sigma-70 factor (ECF subfamily)